MSGAGRIKGDGHGTDGNTHYYYEHKLAARSHTVNAKYLEEIWTQAIRAGYDEVRFVIEFDNPAFTLRATIEKGATP